MRKSPEMLYNETVMNMYGRTRRILRGMAARLTVCRRGAAAVEFALIAPVLLAGLTGVANYGIAMHDKMELVSAARSGAQLAIFNGTNTTSTQTDAIKTAVVAASNLSIATTDVTATETYNCDDNTSVSASTDTCADNEPVQYYMTVAIPNYTFNPMLLSQDAALLIFGRTLTLSGSVTVRTK